MQAAKDAHVEAIDAEDETSGSYHAEDNSKMGSREALILETTLAKDDIVLEPNFFPYDTPPGIEHWTLWSRRELRHREICAFVTRWCVTAEGKPHHSAAACSASSDRAFGSTGKACSGPVVEWNYEDNVHRSFLVPHVHVFLRRALVSQATGVAAAAVLPLREGSLSAHTPLSHEEDTGSSDSPCRKRRAPSSPSSDDDGSDRARSTSADCPLNSSANGDRDSESDTCSISSLDQNNMNHHEFDGAGGGGGYSSSGHLDLNRYHPPLDGVSLSVASKALSEDELRAAEESGRPTKRLRSAIMAGNESGAA